MGLDELSLEVVPLQHAAAADLAETVNQVLVRVFPDERTNSLVVQGRPDELKRALYLIVRLDRKKD